MQRIAAYAETEIRFNLLALINDRQEVAEREVEELKSQNAVFTKLLRLEEHIGS